MLYQNPPNSYDGDNDAKVREIYACGIPEDAGWIINVILNIKAPPQKIWNTVCHEVSAH